MDKPAWSPLAGIGTNGEFAVGANALRIVPQLGNDTIVGVEDCDAGVEFGHDHQILIGSDVGRQAEAGQRFDGLAVEGQALQRVVCPVGNDQPRLTPAASIDPQAVRRIEFAIARTGPTERRLPVAVFVVAVDVVRAG